MESFTTHKGKVALLDRSNIDTDQIIPKQFLKKIDRIGYGEHLFQDWRFQGASKPNPDFSLNLPKFDGASILVTRSNFGCGSSREHAVWALMQYGFRVILAQRSTHAPAFADIFRNNSMKNGLLTIALSETEIEEIFKIVDQNAPIEMEIDLPNQTCILFAPEKEKKYPFDFSPTEKDRLLKGLDDIALTMQFEKEITEFEKRNGL